MSLTLLSVKDKSPKHLKNQDSMLVSLNGSSTILIIADGHGGTPYVRSSIGSRIACLAAKKAVDSGLTGEELKAAVKDSYDRLVSKHITLNPFKESEKEKLFAHSDIDAYGTTLAMVILHPDSTECLILGDSEIHLLGANGRFIRPFAKDSDCSGNITSSMCYDTCEAIAHMRRMTLDQPIAAAILFTDGYMHKTDRPYDLIALLNVQDDEISLKRKFSEVMKKGRHGDDQTCIFAYNSDVITTNEFQKGLACTIEEGKVEMQKQVLACQISRLQREVDNVQAIINRYRAQNDTDRMMQLSKLLQPDCVTLESLKNEYKGLTPLDI